MKKKFNPEDENNYKKHMGFYHPPLLPMPDIPVCHHHGSFLIKRLHDYHTGVDLYTPPDSPVYAVEDGEIVKIRWFTGVEAECDFWNSTKAIDVEGYTGTICYGEIEPNKDLKEGDRVVKGQILGKVIPVLKKFKGKPRSMLHFAVHSRGWGIMVSNNENRENEPIYDLHIDPTLLLIQLKSLADFMMLKEAILKGKNER